MALHVYLYQVSARTHVFVEDEMFRNSTRRTRIHLPVHTRKLYLSYTRILAVPHIDKSALICCVEYMRNSKKSSPLINNVEKYKFDAGAGVSVAHSRLSMPRNAVQHYLE